MAREFMVISIVLIPAENVCRVESSGLSSLLM